MLWLGLTIFSLFVLLFPLSVLGLVKPTNQFYVNDYANIIDSEVEEYIMSRSVSLANETGAQTVVVTVPSLEGENLEKYATDLFRSFGIGDKEKNNGLLLLLALEECLTFLFTRIQEHIIFSLPTLISNSSSKHRKNCIMP